MGRPYRAPTAARGQARDLLNFLRFSAGPGHAVAEMKSTHAVGEHFPGASRRWEQACRRASWIRLLRTIRERPISTRRTIASRRKRARDAHRAGLLLRVPCYVTMDTRVALASRSARSGATLIGPCARRGGRSSVYVGGLSVADVACAACPRPPMVCRSLEALRVTVGPSRTLGASMPFTRLIATAVTTISFGRRRRARGDAPWSAPVTIASGDYAFWQPALAFTNDGHALAILNGSGAIGPGDISPGPTRVFAADPGASTFAEIGRTVLVAGPAVYGRRGAAYLRTPPPTAARAKFRRLGASLVRPRHHARRRDRVQRRRQPARRGVQHQRRSRRHVQRTRSKAVSQRTLELAVRVKRHGRAFGAIQSLGPSLGSSSDRDGRDTDRRGRRRLGDAGWR